MRDGWTRLHRTGMCPCRNEATESAEKNPSASALRVVGGSWSGVCRRRGLLVGDAMLAGERRPPAALTAPVLASGTHNSDELTQNPHHLITHETVGLTIRFSRLSLGEAVARPAVSRPELEAMIEAGKVEVLPTGSTKMIATERDRAPQGVGGLVLVRCRREARRTRCYGDRDQQDWRIRRDKRSENREAIPPDDALDRDSARRLWRNDRNVPDRE